MKGNAVNHHQESRKAATTAAAVRTAGANIAGRTMYQRDVTSVLRAGS